MPYEPDRLADWDPYDNPDIASRVEDPQTQQDYALRDRYNRGDVNLTSAYNAQRGITPFGWMSASAVILGFLVIFIIGVVHSLFK